MNSVVRWGGVVAGLTLVAYTLGASKSKVQTTQEGDTAAVVSAGPTGKSEPQRRVRTGRISDRFPNIVLRTQHNKLVHFYDDLVKDKTLIINFMYTTCELL